MSQAEELAQRLRDANEQVVAAVEACGEDEWQATSEAEGWTAAALAHHIALDHELISGVVVGMAQGGFELGLSGEQLNEMNAQHAADFASVGKQEVIDLANKNCQAAAAAVAALNDDQLKESADFLGTTMTAGELADQILIGHALGHLASFKATTGQA